MSGSGGSIARILASAREFTAGIQYTGGSIYCSYHPAYRLQTAFRQPDPVGRADRQQIVVEVIARIVQIAWPQPVAEFAVLALAVTDEHIAARLVLQHEGEVLGAHGRFDRGVDIGVADHRLHHLDRE